MASRFTRRSVLKSIIVVAAASSGAKLLSGCGKDDNDNGNGGNGGPQAGEQFFPQSVASGDPREASVILWTRIVDGEGDRTLRVQVATDAEFKNVVAEQESLTARAEHDGCVKVKVVGLEPRTTYHYRFLYEKDGTRYSSRVGRTRTAAAADEDVPVRFAIANCQDYTGRFYNTHQRLLQLDADLDFVLCVGDYVYETTGDPSFQSAGARRLAFSDIEGAIALGSVEARYYAARALSNYRELYRTYRGDAQLRALHERYPFIVTWDDHEFANDSYGATSTHFEGARDETDPERRRNAEQAFFEYLPIDEEGAGEGVIEKARDSLYPNTKLWRGFDFGKNFRLLMTDYRSFRPDHLLREDAFPGTVLMDQAALPAPVLNALPEADFAYVDIDAPEFAVQKATLRQVVQILYQQKGLSQQDAAVRAEASVKGNLALRYVNSILATTPVGAISTAGRSRGIAYVHFAKLDLFTSLGTRFFPVKNWYDLYASYLYASAGPETQDAFGAAQQAWLYDQIATTPATWCGLVSSVSLTSMPIKLQGKPNLDPLLNQDFYYSTDQWDGFPDKRTELLNVVKQQRQHNTLALSGDIHASFVSALGGQASNVSVTAPALSSTTMKSLISGAVQAAASPQLNTGAGTPFYTYVVDQLDDVLRESNADISFTNTDKHGFVIVEADGTQAVATFHLISEAESKVDYGARPDELPSKFEVQAFTFASTRPT